PRAPPLDRDHGAPRVGAGQPIAIELDAFVVALRDDPFERRGRARDSPGDQQPPTDLEEQMVLATLVLDVTVALGEQPPELEQSLARQDDADFLVGFAFYLRLVTRHADERH